MRSLRAMFGLGLFLSYAIFYVSPASADGMVKNLKDYEYRDSGQPWKCTVYDAKNGRLKGRIYYSGDGIPSKVERFDESGNKIEAAFYDAKGNLKAGPDNWAAMRWYYEGTALRLQISYDAMGKPIERLFYTEGGKLIGRHYLDNGNVDPYVNAAMFRKLGANNIAFYDPKESFAATRRMEQE
jgi:hypothetical protein